MRMLRMPLERLQPDRERSRSSARSPVSTPAGSHPPQRKLPGPAGGVTGGVAQAKAAFDKAQQNDDAFQQLTEQRLGEAEAEAKAKEGQGLDEEEPRPG
eukprot:s659_g1.t1